MSLFSRNSDLPGLHATLRDCTPHGRGFKKLSAGDFAVVDATDISRQEAQHLADAGPAAVLNISQFATGTIPNTGPRVLLDAKVQLVEGLGETFRNRVKDGKKVRLTEEGEVYSGEKLLGEGQFLDSKRADEVYAEAQRGLVDRMEAYFGNSIQFIHAEGPLLIDGLGIPDLGTAMQGRKVIVVSPSEDHRAKIKLLRNFIREYEPMTVAVGAAADSLMDMGYTPDVVIADPTEVEAETLRAASKVVLPAAPDGRAPGLERIQDLGVGAVTFPSTVDSVSDLALLLVDYHEADMIVQVGGAVDLDQVFAAADNAAPSAYLARMKAGRKVVDADAVISLYTAPAGGTLAWLWALLAILVAIAVIVLVAGFGGQGSFVENLEGTWDNISSIITGWFS
ncbi:thiamine pyrophosphokinase [Corynebacterium phocae]|uniref:Thiamine pyrophosphokinase n=1 Tax=Corynebacterium phocae TaxID=161895 RepID=A0A1L7D374_9CORY|nr:putative cytokinetic ring protein SteA [Corynebacterium phocae]APT92574.1 thiamine pyrophosphokinase [Corynebacterium phocae]KAA8725174.1 thiamine pyrophosphokinase [Corynebacterium phocae]